MKKRVSIEELSSCRDEPYDENDLVEEFEYHLWSDVSPPVNNLDFFTKEKFIKMSIYPLIDFTTISQNQLLKQKKKFS